MTTFKVTIGALSAKELPAMDMCVFPARLPAAARPPAGARRRLARPEAVPPPPPPRLTASPPAFHPRLPSPRSPPRSGGTSDPFLKIVFDNFKTVQTTVKNRELNPRWEGESFTFPYSTRYADCLARKHLVFEVFDHNNFSANALIGYAKADLHSLAAGCAALELPIRDGRKARGTLFAEVRMEEVADDPPAGAAVATLTFARLSVDGADAASVSALERLKEAQLVVAGPSKQRIESAPSSGALLRSSGWPKSTMPVVKLRGTLTEIMASHVELSLLAPAGRDVLGAGRLSVSEWRSFVAGEIVEFSVPLAATQAGKAAGVSADGLIAVGSIVFAGLPVFSQLPSGLKLADGSIRGASVPFPDLPNLPKVPVLDATGRALDMAQMARDLAAKRSKIAGSLARGVSKQQSSRFIATPRATATDLSMPIYTPGVAGMRTPPAPADRLFGGAAHFPACWVRRENGPTGEVAFENLCSGLMEAALPTDNEYVVTVAATTTGPLGLLMEANFSGRERFGIRSGRRNSGFDLGAVVRGVKPDTVLARTGRLRPGHHLLSINGAACNRLTFAETVNQLKAAGRPLVLRFHDPYAVPSNVAQMALKANVNEKQAAGSSAMIGGRRLDHTAMTQKKFGADKKQAAQAQATLDLALKMLAKIDVAKADELAVKLGDGPAAAAQRAMQDPGFLRAITSSVTGNAMDVAPAQVREQLEAANREKAAVAKREADRASKGPLSAAEEEKEKAAQAEEDEARDLTEEAEAEAASGQHTNTSDSVATAAVAALTNIATSGGAAAGKVDAEMRALIDERAARMAKAGVWSRALEAVTQRNAPEYSSAAVGAVAQVAAAHEGAAMSDLGLSGSALIAVQGVARRNEFKGEMVEAVQGLSRSLAAENEDQDGEGYLRLIAECVQGIAEFTTKQYSRMVSPKDGSTFYTLPGGASDTRMPAPMRAVFDKLVRLDHISRTIEDAAVVSGSKATVTVEGKPVPLLKALPFAIEGQETDAFLVSVLLGCAAKLAYLPSNARVMIEQGSVLSIVDQTLSHHPNDLRMCECVAALYFNVGRELDQSEALLRAGVVAKVTLLARAYLKARQTWTGSVCSWPPEGKEAEVGEVVVLPSSARLARDKNTSRPRLVRTCINVLINLACYRKPVANGATSVDLIVSCRGVELLGEVLLAHISDVAVVTSVLNCAANIAFKNQAVQLAIGQTMTDAIVLSGWSFQRDVALLSMALRAIGNLTNEDVNIYRGLGFGVLRMMSTAMRNNGSDVALQTLAASVLSNIASVEAVEDATLAAEDLALFSEVHAMRCSHPAIALRPEAADVENVRRLLDARKQTWQITPWLMLDEGAVACLISAMQRNSTDIVLIDACLRSLTSVASNDDPEVAAALISRHDLVGKTLFVMRAADFDVGVQAAGVNLLNIFASQPLTLPAVVATDAALMLLMALETHKASLVVALQQASAAMAAVQERADGDAAAMQHELVRCLASALEGRPTQVLALATRICETTAVLSSSGVRAIKAALELGSPLSVATMLQSALGVFNAMARRGVAVIHLQAKAGNASVHALTTFCESCAQLLASWVRHPAARAAVTPGADGRVVISADEEAACFAVRAALTSGGRSHAAVMRLCELCVLGTGEAGSPATLAVSVRCARAVAGLFAALIVRGAALPELSNVGGAEGAGASAAPFLEVDGAAIEGIVGANGCGMVGALLLAGCQAIMAMLASQTQHWQARGYVQFDTAATIARLLVAQVVVLLDALGSVAGNADEAGLCADILDAAAAAVASVVAANAGFAAADITPGPLRLSDIADACQRASARLNARVAAHAASGATAAQAPTFGVSEARALFCFSMARAKAQTATGAAHGKLVSPPSYAEMVPPAPAPAADAAAAGGPQAAAPPQPPAEQQAPAPAAAPTPTRSGKSLSRARSVKIFTGALSQPGGVLATMWHEGTATPVAVLCDARCVDLLLFPAALAKKGGPSALADTSKAVAIVPGGAFDHARIGKPIAGGKSADGGGKGGWFSGKKAPKPEWTVCLDDAEGNTLVQIEAASAKAAEALQAACEGLAQGFLLLGGAAAAAGEAAAAE